MWYSILPGAVWFGAVHTCSHTCFIDRFMMSEGGDPLSLPFTSKTGQSQSVAQNRQASFSYITSIKRKYIFWHFIDIISDFRILKIELNERYFLPFLIDFYPSIPAILDYHCHLFRHYENCSLDSCKVENSLCFKSEGR